MAQTQDKIIREILQYKDLFLLEKYQDTQNEDLMDQIFEVINCMGEMEHLKTLRHLKDGEGQKNQVLINVY